MTTEPAVTHGLTAARRAELCAAADAYLAELVAEHGEPTPDDEAWAQALVDRLAGRVPATPT